MLTPRDTFVEASRPISTRREDQDRDTGAAYIEPNRFPRVVFPILVLLNSIATAILWLIMFIGMKATNNNYKNLSYWAQLSSMRFPSVVQTLSLAYLAAILNAQGPTPYIDSATIQGLMIASLNVAEEANYKLTVNAEGENPINKFSDYIDKLHYDPTCEVNITDSETSTHDAYHCLSGDMLFMIFNKLVRDVYLDLGTGMPILSYPSFINLEHIAIYHLLPILENVNDYIIEESTTLDNTYADITTVLMVVNIVLALVFFILEQLDLRNLQESFGVFRILMSRIPPSQVISNPSLLNLIIGKTKSTRIQQLSAESAVIDSSPSAIFSLSSELTIEAMNSAASSMFGYTPEQLLGQALCSLIPMSQNSNTATTTTTLSQTQTTNELSPNDRLYRQAQLMKQNQAAMTYTSKIRGLKDDGTEIVLESTLLCMNRGMAFALIANDQTQIERQMRQVEEAKKSAERLLNQILPPMIVQKMNAGETEISFTVNSATIIFIDIQKFSDYAATLTARQIMQNLGRIFNYYDELVPKFPTLIKIKLIGDVYMAAAGLFNPDVSPDVHATEMINFAIGCLHGLEEANEILEASLSVRIGINTGGPIIAGVLGIDKPLFDIIGDPINVASRLQSTDIPNMIQISQATYDLIKDKGFNVAERGKIFLKGKGEQMAYIITPPERQRVISAQTIPSQLSVGALPTAEEI
ncbi:Adenylate and Guanylate cyclase catalytic domain containing protein [Trichomonas vaginalis G3]|uniref:Adenylate and Guanylate cyclase catalytic domain containing protein n=1 Tax=Trichomonas vaginalis (strain ATCC PRA-98 / G3) TaxID=412133 RepID=A2DXM9_TRIV3|nr:guanylate cyclase protein [Trichomonas vaginalis G3]EAY14858.1 Adenylate and Guanylate cyclase catalytic domain containing protein [Trichomonas vaginalis G3]KAI5541161.1 guanylate cyclase protein [Trichomonas vaginalis G3]|eukprot:XP_001327081.1 Adenylate and Guanylate cyclase catalytic domain containing protein [Trichomonas vaginalis G3]